MSKYFIDHFEKNISLWPIIKKIKKSCRVGLLTNMYVGMFDEIKKHGLLPPIDWGVIIDSSKVGLQKPDPKIFEFAREKSGVCEDEILFIDNSEKNIKAAKKFGWQVYLYNSSKHEESAKNFSEFINSTIV